MRTKVVLCLTWQQKKKSFKPCRNWRIALDVVTIDNTFSLRKKPACGQVCSPDEFAEYRKLGMDRDRLGSGPLVTLPTTAKNMFLQDKRNLAAEKRQTKLGAPLKDALLSLIQIKLLNYGEFRFLFHGVF
jgi:hypothetical protein